MNKLNLEEGVKEALSTIRKSENKPVLVAVYGGTGKSYFISELAKSLKEFDLSSYQMGNEPTFAVIDDIRYTPRFNRDVVLFHCNGDRDVENEFFNDNNDDPNALARSELSRKIDLNVGIFNPKLGQKLEGEYDLLISNPNSYFRGTIK